MVKPTVRDQLVKVCICGYPNATPALKELAESCQRCHCSCYRLGQTLAGASAFSCSVSNRVCLKQSFPAFSGKNLLDGRFPSCDEYGNALVGHRGAKAGELLAGGWRGAFESWAGDWKERSLSHSFVKRNYQSTQICDQCDAVRPFARTPENRLHLVYSDFSVDAPWTRTMRDHATYLESTPIPLRTPWLQVAGFDICRVKWDVAHVVLLGTGKDLAAAFLWDLVLGMNLETRRNFQTKRSKSSKPMVGNVSSFETEPRCKCRRCARVEDPVLN